MTELRFNVLTDPWIPLDVDGRAQYASYVELLTGERDAEDLVHPRDDVRFYARMLLSALTQALFPAKDAKALRQRIAEPLPRAVVEERIAGVAGDFDLLGARAFLQTDCASERDNATASLFFDARHDLFRPAHEYEAICLSCAPAILYGVHAFATSGGRGYSPGVRGTPPITTLVGLPSVRKTVWANVLSDAERSMLGYPAEPECPWRFQTSAKVGETIGLVEGLFWQPRSVRLVPTDDGSCCACGAFGKRLLASGYAANSRVMGGTYRHPWSPIWEDPAPNARRRYSYRNFRSDRPSWTGLTDLLTETQGRGAKRGEKLARPAPVVRQWTERLDPGSGASLLVLDYSADKARIKGRISEAFPLSRRIADPDFAEYVRSLVERAEDVFDALDKALAEVRRRGKNGKQKGYWFYDANAAFWQRSEWPFWEAFEAGLTGDMDGYERFVEKVEFVALDIFDRHASSSASDPQWIAHVVRARGRLLSRLAQRRKELSHAVA